MEGRIISRERGNIVPNMSCNLFTLVRRSIHKNPLNQVIAVLITGDCLLLVECMHIVSGIGLTVNQGHPRPIATPSANPRKILIHEL